MKEKEVKVKEEAVPCTGAGGRCRGWQEEGGQQGSVRGVCGPLLVWGRRVLGVGKTLTDPGVAGAALQKALCKSLTYS